MTRYQRTCARCVLGRVQRSSKLCPTCRASGWRWCTIGRHVATALDCSGKNGCMACKRAYERRRLGTVQPGYITLKELAPRLGYSPDWLRFQVAKRGWCSEYVKRRTPHGKIYIREMSEYPALIYVEVAR